MPGLACVFAVERLNGNWGVRFGIDPDFSHHWHGRIDASSSVWLDQHTIQMRVKNLPKNGQSNMVELMALEKLAMAKLSYRPEESHRYFGRRGDVEVIPDTDYIPG